MQRNTAVPRILLFAFLIAALWYLGQASMASSPNFVSSGSISVRLTEFCGPDPVELEMRGSWNVKDADGSILLAGSNFRGWLTPDPTGVLLGARLLGNKTCTLSTDGDAGIRLRDKTYRGELQIKTTRGASGLPHDLDIVLQLPLEDYVLGVLCGEMPSSTPGAEEALRAQAVVARTWALWKTNLSGKPLRDTPADQKFVGVDFETQAAQRAVTATEGLILAHAGELIPAFFHADCGGETANSAAVGFTKRQWAPLSGVKDANCISPFKWSRTIPASTLDSFARTHGLGNWISRLQASARDSGGRWLKIELTGPSARGPFFGEDLRTGFAVPSALWQKLTVHADGSLVIAGTGNGHGVGLCQKGALNAAQKGHDYREILKHYYPESLISTLYINS